MNISRVLFLLGCLAPVAVMAQSNNPGNSGKGPGRFFGEGTAYQNRATVWLATHPLPGGVSFINSAQRYALACIYFATYQQPNKYTAVEDTSPWKVETDWLSDKPECEWFGIECNPAGQITMIDLSSNSLSGNFPLEVQVLVGVNYLDISSNSVASLSGALVWLSGFINLVHLDVHNTNLDYPGIPPWLEGLVSLEYLDISQTFFYGPLNGTIFAPLQNLTYLEMGYNDYEFGPVPTEIASLPLLDHLYMESSNLSGDLSFIELLNADMFEMWLDFGNFPGEIPDSLNRLTGLVSLSLTGCGLTGSLSSDMNSLTKLKQLWLYNNTLTGTIPAEFGELTNLETFQTEDNAMDGSMPSTVCALTGSSGMLDALSTDCAASMTLVSCDCCDCCESPCFPPAPAPPPSLGFCFSGVNSVETSNRGTIQMEDLEIGDDVSIGDGKFSRVYSFGHYNEQMPSDYLQIHGPKQPLEMSDNHMVFVKDRGAVAAGNVVVGDNLILGDASTVKVSKLTKVQRIGAYAPFTEEGTIVVNDVLASSYVSLQDNSDFFMVGDINVVSMHSLAHIFQAPHRMICKLNANFCMAETYTTDGIANWVYGPYLAAQWLLDQNIVLFAALSVPVLLSATFLYIVEAMMNNAGIVVLAGAAALAVYNRQTKKMA